MDAFPGIVYSHVVIKRQPALNFHGQCCSLRIGLVVRAQRKKFIGNHRTRPAG